MTIIFLTSYISEYINSGPEGRPSSNWPQRALGDDPTQRTPFSLGGLMGISDIRPGLFSGTSRVDQSDPDTNTARPLLKNFQICPHCEKKGRPPIVERLNEDGPVISRSDGVSFHLVLGDRPISFPAEKSSGKTQMITAGFWYVSEQNGSHTSSTETVVVILRKAPGVSVMRQLEAVADKLAEKLTKSEYIERVYEFYGNRLHRLW